MKEKAGTPRAKKPRQLTLIGPEPTPKTSAKPPKKPARPAPPTTPQWQALYAVAARFKELGPWNWTHETDTFGVRNPETGVIGYCSIMGASGQHFALAAYLGSRGLTGYLKILRGASIESEIDLYALQDGLTISFENREFLAPKDHKVIRELGLKFRGANAWPLFRRLRPGHIPWYINGAEASFLTTVLDQAIDVVTRARTNPGLLRTDEDERYLVRTSTAEAGVLVWQDEWLEPEPLTDEDLAAEARVLPATMDYLGSLQKSATTRYGEWEFDISCVAEAVQAERGGQPYFLRLFLVADATNGIIISTAVSDPDNYVMKFGEALARTVKQLEGLPSRILVRNDATEAFIGQVAMALQIPLERTRLKQVAKIQRGLKKMLSKSDFRW